MPFNCYHLALLHSRDVRSRFFGTLMTLVVFSLSPRQVTAPGLISYDDYAQFCIYLAGRRCLTNKMI